MGPNQIKLRDEDPQMVAAWRREFRDCSEVQISCGKIFDDDKWDAVMMPMTNSFGWTDVEPVCQLIIKVIVIYFSTNTLKIQF